MSDLTWIEISTKSIKHNFQVLKSLVTQDVLTSPCVKGNAYGHGIVEVSRILESYGADWLCVNSAKEAETLRVSGINIPILIIGPVLPKNLPKVIDLDARMFISNINTAEELNQCAESKNVEASIHIKVDTGMGRQGVLPNDLDTFIKDLRKLANIKVEGLATHFATSDTVANSKHFNQQAKQFKKLVNAHSDIPLRQCSNSAAILAHNEFQFNFVRPGKSIYGHYPSKEVKRHCLQKSVALKPSLTLKTRIAQIKTLSQGSCIGYGCTFKTTKITKIAILPIGYYDGLDRKLSNKGTVLINGKRAPIVGNICMNLTMVDITDIGIVSLWDEVVIIGAQGKEKITVEEMAKLIGTINYEIVSRLRENLPRYYL